MTLFQLLYYATPGTLLSRLSTDGFLGALFSYCIPHDVASYKRHDWADMCLFFFIGSLSANA